MQTWRHGLALILVAACLFGLALGGELLLARWAWYNGAPGYARAVMLNHSQALILGGVHAGEVRVEPAIRIPGGAKHQPGQTLLLRFGEHGEAGFAGIARERGILLLLAFFVWVVIVTGGRHGWRTLTIMALALLGPLSVAPLLLKDWPPVPVMAILCLGLLAIMVRINIVRAAARLAAFIGAACSLLLTAGLALTMVSLLRLTGVHDWSTRGLWQLPAGRHLDFPGLLIAGLIICSLGVVMDLATAISVSIHEVAEINPHLDRRALQRAGLRVGRDVIGTEINTLVFAFAGANVGLMLLPVLGSRVTGFEIPLMQAVSSPPAAIGIAEMLLATTGLVATIPLTAWIGSWLVVQPPATAAHVSAVPETGDWRPRKTAGVLTILGFIWLMAAAQVGRDSHTYQVRPGVPASVQRHLIQARINYADVLPETILQQPDGLRAEVEQNLAGRMLSGPLRGGHFETINSYSGQPGNDRLVRPGDRVLLELRISPDGDFHATLLDLARMQPLLAMLTLLLAAVLITGHNHGLRAILALGCSGTVVWGCVLMVGVWGLPAVPVFALGALPLSTLVFLILAGVSRKALIAGAGSLAAILSGGLAALACAWAMRFSGLHSGDLMAIRLFANPANLDFRGLYVAGILLGTLGVAMDLSIAVASAAVEIRAADTAAPRRVIHARALTVGRSLMAPMTLTLLCAYLGMNLPLIILPWASSGVPLAVFLNRDPVSAEIVRILAGCLGVAAAVPFTAWFAAWWLPPRDNNLVRTGSI